MRSTTSGWMQVDCGSWIRWALTSQGAAREYIYIYLQYTVLVQRAAKRYGDGGGGSRDVGLRLVLLAAVMMMARSLPPQTNRRRMTKKRGARRKYSQLCVV